MCRWFILEKKIDNKETTSVHEKKTVSKSARNLPELCVKFAQSLSFCFAIW